RPAQDFGLLRYATCCSPLGFGSTVTSSQPSSPHWSRICLVAWIRSGTVAYSHFVMRPSVTTTARPDPTGSGDPHQCRGGPRLATPQPGGGSINLQYVTSPLAGWTDELARARLHFVTGKGGTGKTTLAASLGLALARGGRRVLLIEVEGRQGFAQLF